MSTWTWESTWPAPAKINLFLHVVGRRADGYHLLQTAFRFLDLSDAIQFSPREDGSVVRALPNADVLEQDDLVVRAARLLRQATGITRGVTIRLHKKLPMGGGLGGGSSDAATTLIALNHLWHTGLTRSQLQSLALPLGADVPVFIYGRTAFAEGIGERFSAIFPPPCYYLLVMPNASVPTADIFRTPALPRNTPPIDATQWVPGFGHNDLESVACARYEPVREALDKLKQLGPSRMSGSGACCFAEFADETAALTAQSHLPDSLHSQVCQGVDAHPLYDITPDQ